MKFLLAGIIGLLSGITSGLFGVGGGVVMVPAMTLLLGMNVKHAVGTSLAVIIPTAVMGTWKHHQQGNVKWDTALSLVIWAVIGGYLGAWWVAKIPADTLKRVFGGFIVVVGLRLLFGK